MWLADQQPLVIPIQPQYQRSLGTIFDKCKAIRFISTSDVHLPKIRNMPSLNAQPHAPFGNGVDHFKHIYRDMLHLDYRIRWTHSPLVGNRYCRINQVRPPVVKYAFVHDDVSRRFVINQRWIGNGLLVIRPERDGTILQYCSLIEHAVEVHCIDSSFFHLTEHLQPRGRLFLHQYARPYVPIWMDYDTRHEWTRL